MRGRCASQGRFGKCGESGEENLSNLLLRRPLRTRMWHRLGGAPVWLPAFIEGLQSQAVESKVKQRTRPINQIAPPQPSGLLQEPE